MFVRTSVISIITLAVIIYLSRDTTKYSPSLYQKMPFKPAEEWFEKQRAFPFDEIPQQERLNSIEYVKNNMSIETFSGSAVWQPAGPTNIEGRITSVAIHPANPQIVYAATANGGVWKSTNFCQSWVSVFDNQNTSSIGAIALDPVNPEIIYCGTGESNSLRSYYPGTGMFKSTNGGQSWMFAGLSNTYCFGNIAINPLNTQIVYAAALGSLRRKNTERGIYKSTNGGITWSHSLYLSDSVGAIDVAIDRLNPDRVFAAMWERQRREDYIKYGGPMSGLYRTTNGGASWNLLSGGFPANDATLGRISIDISYSNPQIIYALTAFTNGNSRGLYKSTDGGNSWTHINTSVAQSSNFAWFNRICKVHPSNPDIVYCGGLNMERSTNGGVSFSQALSTHVDQHAVAFSLSNPDYIVIGNDGGIDYSSNGGSSWNYSNSLPITQFYAGEIDINNPAVILGGTQDNGTVRTTNGGLNNWTMINGGDGFYCIVDYSNPQFVYASSQYGALVRSTNGGNSFLGATSGLDLTYTNWMTPFVIDKNNPQIFYCGTYRIHRSTNRMQSWTAISPDLANGHVQLLGTITTVDVSRSNPNVIYCGTDDANVWVTTNGGANWVKINQGLPYRWVTRVTVHPDSANVCYVTLSGYKVDSAGSHVYRTANFGANWVSIGGNLPDAPVNDILIDPLNYNTLYIATDITVMFTTNLGASWQVLGSGFPSNVPCHDLTLHNPSRTLIAWTHGRSAFKINLSFLGIVSDITTPAGFNLSQNFPNPFNSETTIEFEIPKSSFVRLSVYDVTGREIEVLANENLSAGKYEVKWDAGKYSSGVYLYRLLTDGFVHTRKMTLVK